MKIRPTARATARERRQHQRRASQSVALGLMVAGLVLGAFAAPSLAAEDLGGATGAAAPEPSTSTSLDVPPANGQGTGGSAGTPSIGGSEGAPGPVLPPGQDDDCPGSNVDLEKGVTGCQTELCLTNPNQENCPATPTTPGTGTPGTGTPGTGTPGTGTPGTGTPGTGTPGTGTPGTGTPGTGTPGTGTPGTGTPGTGTPGTGTPGTGSPNTPGAGNPSTPSTGPTGTSGNRPTGNGSLSTTLGQAEGTVPGAAAATQVSACGDSVICQSAPAATSTAATTGLPETGAAENSRQLLVLGLGLLTAGGLLLRPVRRGRHRLLGA